MTSPLDGRIILVTGASRGLGRAVALAAARAGATVVATARTKGALEEMDDELRAEGRQAILLPLDLLDGTSADLLGPSIAQRFGRLDGLVHCAAALGPLTPTHQIDTAELEAVLRLDALAAQRLLRSLHPVLAQSDAAHLVFLDDQNARVGRPFFATYAASKAAQRAIIEAYAAEQRKSSMRIEIVDPGPMRTRLRRATFPGEPDDAQPPPDAAAADIVRRLAGSTDR